MKRFLKKTFAIVLSLAMIMTNGMGVVAFAADGNVDNRVLNVKVIDQNGDAVTGANLYLKPEASGFASYKFTSASDVNGIAKYECNASDFLMDDTVYVISTKDTSYTIDEDVKVAFALDDDWNNYINTVDGKEYTGEVTLKVTKSGTSTDPVIESVEFPETAAKAASSIEVKVKGKNLPDTFNCRIKANYDDGMGSTTTTNGNYADVEATGTATERIITLVTPYCADPLSWTIDVRLPFDYDYAQKQTGTVAAVANTPEEPTDTVDKFVLNLEVKDANGSPVQGLAFVLVKGSQSIEVPGTTDAEGKLSYNVAKNYSLYGDYTLKLAPHSGYLLAAEPTISVGMDPANYDATIEKVNGEAYTGNIALTAAVDENAEPAPVIDRIEAPATLTKDASSVQIKVVGENLPTTFNCKFVANFDDGFGNTMPTTGSWSDVEATGTATERIITLVTPHCAEPLSWDVSVRLEDKTQTKTAHIALGETPVEPVKFKLLQDKYSAYRGTTNNVVIIDCTKYEKALAFADTENVKDYFYFSWSNSSDGTGEDDLTLGADDTITIDNNVITITLADEKASTPGFVFLKEGALVNSDDEILGKGEFGAKNYKYIIAGSHIKSINYNQLTFDHNGGHVVATITGTNLSAGQLASAKIFLDNAAKASDIQPTITVESSTKATIEWDVAPNTSAHTVTYRMLPVINGVTVAPQQMEGYDIIAVLPEGKTTDAVTLSSLEVTGSNDKNDAIDVYETEITSADFTAKVELIIRGSNLDGKLAAIKAVDENGVEWPTLPVHECGATVRWQSSANYIAESQSINEKRIELLPPRHLYTSHTFKIYVAPDGVNFDEHVYATIVINNNGIYDPADGFTPEQLSVLKDVTVKYVDENGNDIVPAETRKGYGITELYTLDLGAKEFDGYEYVRSTPSNIDTLIEPPRLTEAGDYVFDGGQFFVKHLEKNNLEVVHTYKTLEKPDFTYTIADGKCTITGLTETGAAKLAENNGALTIPAELDGAAVTTIGKTAFMNNTDIKSVTFPASVTTIEQQAFQGTGLTALVLPDTVTTLGLGAFTLCASLADITISKNIETIPQNAFAQTAVKTVVIPEGVKTIGRMAFNGTPVENLTIASTVELIDQQAFQNNKLTSVEIPASVKTIGNYAFRVIANNGPMTTVTLNEGLESIGNGAFAGLNLTEVAVPATLKTLHYNAFTGNQNGKVRVLSTVADQKTATGDYTAIGVANAKATFYMPWMVEFDLAGGEMDAAKIAFVDEDGKIALPTPTKTGFDFAGWIIDKDTKVDENTVFEADTVVTATWAEPENVRYAGATRYDTALEVADALKAAKGGQKFSAIVVADGGNYPDALTGGYLAKVKDAPIILVNSSSESKIADYIKENLAEGGQVYILGGTGAVSASFEKQVKTFADVKRLGGASRYETNILILKEAGVTDGYTGDILICSGTGYADSLSASAAGKPILLVGSSLTAGQKTYLNSMNPGKYYVIGGTGVVSQSVEKSLGTNTERVAGATRYETSAKVAETFFPQGSAKAVFSYAQNFPDGLAGSALAMQLGAPLILTDNSANGVAVAKTYAGKAGVKTAVILGGETLISDASIEKIIK